MHQLSVFLFAALCFTSVHDGGLGFKVPVEKEKVAGIWAFKTDAGHAKLSGIVSVWKEGDAYVVQWSGRGEIADGSKAIVQLAGVGLLTDDLFAIAWSDGKGHGLSVFRITGKSAHGRWSPASGSRVVDETWTWIAAHKE